MEDLQTGRPAAEIDGSGHRCARATRLYARYLGQTPQWREPCITSQWATPWVNDVHAQTTQGITMSGTTERILIVIFLIVAVLLAMRDAHAGMIGKLNPCACSQSHTTVDPTIRATVIARLNTP
jgi:hypothetical protein